MSESGTLSGGAEEIREESLTILKDFFSRTKRKEAPESCHCNNDTGCNCQKARKILKGPPSSQALSSRSSHFSSPPSSPHTTLPPSPLKQRRSSVLANLPPRPFLDAPEMTVSPGREKRRGDLYSPFDSDDGIDSPIIPFSSSSSSSPCPLPTAPAVDDENVEMTGPPTDLAPGSASSLSSSSSSTSFSIHPLPSPSSLPPVLLPASTTTTTSSSSSSCLGTQSAVLDLTCPVCSKEFKGTTEVAMEKHVEECLSEGVLEAERLRESVRESERTRPARATTNLAGDSLRSFQPPAQERESFMELSDEDEQRSLRMRASARFSRPVEPYRPPDNLRGLFLRRTPPAPHGILPLPAFAATDVAMREPAFSRFVGPGEDLRALEPPQPHSESTNLDREYDEFLASLAQPLPARLREEPQAVPSTSNLPSLPALSAPSTSGSSLVDEGYSSAESLPVSDHINVTPHLGNRPLQSLFEERSTLDLEFDGQHIRQPRSRPFPRPFFYLTEQHSPPPRPPRMPLGSLPLGRYPHPAYPPVAAPFSSEAPTFNHVHEGMIQRPSDSSRTYRPEAPSATYCPEAPSRYFNNRSWHRLEPNNARATSSDEPESYLSPPSSPGPSPPRTTPTMPELLSSYSRDRYRSPETHTVDFVDLSEVADSQENDSTEPSPTPSNADIDFTPESPVLSRRQSSLDPWLSSFAQPSSVPFTLPPPTPTSAPQPTISFDSSLVSRDELTCPYPSCDQRKVPVADFTRHVRDRHEHEEQQALPCPLCQRNRGGMTALRPNLYYHVRSAHEFTLRPSAPSVDAPSLSHYPSPVPTARFGVPFAHRLPHQYQPMPAPTFSPMGAHFRAPAFSPESSSEYHGHWSRAFHPVPFVSGGSLEGDERFAVEREAFRWRSFNGFSATFPRGIRFGRHEREEEEEQPLFIEETLKEDIPGKECAICIEQLAAGDTVARLACLCVYHKACILQWFAKVKKCPIHRDTQLKALEEEGRKMFRTEESDTPQTSVSSASAEVLA